MDIARVAVLVFSGGLEVVYPYTRHHYSVCLDSNPHSTLQTFSGQRVEE